MGVDKARIPFPGMDPMAIAVAKTLGLVCDRVALVRRGEPDGLPWGIEVIRDSDVGVPHPLNGVVAGLRACVDDFALFTPCDVPFLRAEDLDRLINGEASVAFDGERAHPLVAVYPTAWLQRAEAVARSGGSVHSFADDARRIDIPREHLANFNAWEDTGHKGPVRGLLERLDGLGDAETIAVGELGRLAGMGVVDPEQTIRYARLLLGESP